MLCHSLASSKTYLINNVPTKPTMAATVTATLAVVGCPLRHNSPFLHIPRRLNNTTTTTLISKPAAATITWKKLQAQQQPRGFGSSTPNPNNNKWKQEGKEDIPNASNKEEDEELPQAVIERISLRIVASVVMPMGLGLALLSGFGALKEQNVWDVPFWIPVATSFLTFGASALGIAYGALSSSWDPDIKGSVLGIEQLERNWIELWKE